MINYKVIGKRIQFFRLRKRLTQEYVAEKTGVSVPHLSRIENGSGKPSLQTLVNICNVLNVSIDDLMQENLSAIKEQSIKRLQDVCTPDEASMLIEILQTIRLQYKKDGYIK